MLPDNQQHDGTLSGSIAQTTATHAISTSAVVGMCYQHTLLGLGYLPDSWRPRAQCKS